MSYAPRTIALACELVHPPLAPDPPALQRVHNRMFESGDPHYGSFHVIPGGVLFSNAIARPGAVSTAAFLADRFQFREELSSLTPEAFGQRVREVATMVAEARGIQVFPGCHVTVRTLINPRHHRDSRGFLRESVLAIGEELDAFGRDAQLFGLRLAFGPTAEHREAFTLRIESFNSDPRSLFLENQGGFPPLVVANGLAVLEEHVEATYRFTVREGVSFVEHFDRARREP